MEIAMYIILLIVALCIILSIIVLTLMIVIHFIQFCRDNIATALSLFIPLIISIASILRIINLDYTITALIILFTIYRFFAILIIFAEYMDDKIGVRRSPGYSNSSRNHESIGHMTARLQHRITEDDYGNEAYISSDGQRIEDEFGTKLNDIQELNEVYAKDSEGHFHSRN